jgi:hypothetical protein
VTETCKDLVLFLTPDTEGRMSQMLTNLNQYVKQELRLKTIGSLTKFNTAFQVGLILYIYGEKTRK